VKAHTERLRILLGGDQPDIIVPTVGLSVETISSWIRTFLGLDGRHEISGEITIAAGKLWLRLRLKDQEFYTSSAGVDVEKLDDLFVEAVPEQPWRRPRKRGDRERPRPPQESH
jgi:hypothetical protein